MAKCTKTQKLTSLQSTQEQTVAGYIKEGLLLSAVKIMNLNELPLTKKQLLLLRKYHPTSESLFLHLLHSNLVIPMAGLWVNSRTTKRTTSLRKSGKSISTSGRKVSKAQRSGRTGLRTKR